MNLYKLILRSILIISITYVFQSLEIIRLPAQSIRAIARYSSPYPRVYVPNLSSVPFTPAIFWFGSVDPTSNYADTRVWYYDNNLKIVLHIIDRLLWYDTTQTAAELTDWDAVSIYLDLDGNNGGAPGPNSYRFETQLYNDFQAQYRGNGSNWTIVSIPINSYTEWRGSGVNNNEDSEGWVAYFTIPFTSLGLSAAPARGTIWGLGVVMHDRDDAAGLLKQDTSWPVAMNINIPSTWGQLVFGSAYYDSPPAIPEGTATIRQGLNGAAVVDGEVGGHTTCGNGGFNKWTEWGQANYAGYDQINIQNQWDIADWPCFSKFYITFPLDAIPVNKTIISATLKMYLFGNAGGGEWGVPPDSYIEVFIVGQDWNESTLTWNNAPLAMENISGTWVYPRDYSLPDQLYQWDVSKGVDEAYKTGVPLRLAMYSIDGERHSGKYFWSSDVGDWNEQERPTLTVIWGELCNAPGIECHFHYFPLIHK